MKRNTVVKLSRASGGPPYAAGYIRVSSASQDHAYQHSAIESAALARGEKIDHWFADVASGGTMDRPQWALLRAELEAGHIARLWVWRLDRVSRGGIAHTFAAIDLIRRNGATLISVADGLAFEGRTGEIMLAMAAWGAEQERLKIRENQAAARVRREAQGLGWGRPAISASTKDEMARLLSQGKAPGEVARTLNISRTPVYEFLRAQKRKI